MKEFKFDKNTNSLFQAVLSLATIKEAEDFFRDLCTAEEIRLMSERWQIAKLLSQGFSYRKISEKLGVSTTTITRVSYWLSNGQGGYKTALDKPHHNSSLASRKS